MKKNIISVNVKGKKNLVSSWQIGDTILVNKRGGRFLKIAEIFGEYWLESECLLNPAKIINELEKTEDRPDLLTFTQRIPEVTPKYNYHLAWENFAVTRTDSYEEWFEKMISTEARKKIKKSAKRGITTEVVPFDDQLVRGIKSIYDDVPFRQGKRFWHYGKDIDTIKE
jgi:hypothetical protein